MQKFNYYTDEFKLKVIHEVLNGKLSKEEAREKYGLRGKSLVLNWMRSFGYSPKLPKKSKLSLPSLKRSVPDKNIKVELQGLEAEKSAMEQKLKLLQLKLEGYEIMLKIGKEKFGIDLEKKPGAKQSKK